MIGTELGTYRILEQLGEGGMGVVYKAIDTSLDRLVAVKVLNSDYTRNPELVERFRMEARAQANLNHANIAMLHAFVVQGNQAWMVMEYIEGETISQMIQRRGLLPPDLAVLLFKQSLLGIGYAALTLACEAGFTLLAVPLLGRHGAWGVSFHSVWLGAVMFAVLGIVTEGPAAATRLTTAYLLATGYLALLVTVAAFILWYSAVAVLGPDRAGLITGIAPVSAALVGIATGSRAPTLPNSYNPTTLKE